MVPLVCIVINLRGKYNIDMANLKKIPINIVSSVSGSSFVQAARCIAQDNFISLEFVSVHPSVGSEPVQGSLVSRVSMPLSSALELADSIKNTISEHESKNK